MKKMNFSLAGIFIIFSFFIFLSSFAQQPPASQTTGGVSRQEKDVEKRRALEKKIEKKKVKPEEEALEELIPEDSGPKVLVETIVVEEATLLSKEEIEKITSQYEGKELSLKTIQKIVDLITDEYRKKGYATSRAYIPPQTIKNQTLIIRVVEGKLGTLEIKGNRYFKTSLLEKKLNLEPKGYFDYSALQQSLVYINEHPDRIAKAVLLPGKEPGTTDVVIEVEDKFPLHPGLEYDNYGSRYIDKNRYSLILEHNNLTGNDDKMYLKLQYAEAAHLRVQQGRYIYPLSPTLEIGGYFLRNKLRLGKDFQAIDARGTAKIYGLFLNKALITGYDLDLRFNFGFDYKHIKDYLLGAQSSRDEVRVFKGGLDLDLNDRWGRTILTSELDIGVPGILGGMAAKDDNCSRAGAGAKFTKGVFNLFRLQPMPFSSSFLWKNSAQFTNHTLIASEEFQIGGATSVRGYPPAEHAGDKGYYTAFEWSFPFYFLSKTANLPFSEEKMYDTLRFVLFYDWGTTHANRVEPGEKEHETLKGYGLGLRLNVRDDLACRVEIGYPRGKTPSDGDHAHPWVEFSYTF